MSVVHGDCKNILQNIQSESIDMIYLDPPFFTQKTHSQKTRDNTVEYSFSDNWSSADEYKKFVKERLYECHRVLKQTGNIFLHCDKNASHHLRVILDEVFGIDNFRNEIIWSYKRWTSSKSSLQSRHQTIHFYGKSKKNKFNTIYTDYSATTNVDQILQERVRNAHGKSVYKTNDSGEVTWGQEKKGVALGDVWEIPYLNPKAKERVGYPTQKPVLLLERIIEISTDESDTVLDPFCGSGTTLVAAKLMGRKFVGIDISLEACIIAENRLVSPIKTTSTLLEKGTSSYLTKTPLEEVILSSLEATPVQRNSGIDGFLKIHQIDSFIPIKIQKLNESLFEAQEKLTLAAKKRSCSHMVLIRTHTNLEQEQIELRQPHPNIFIIDSLELSIGNWFTGIEQFSRSIS